MKLFRYLLFFILVVAFSCNSSDEAPVPSDDDAPATGLQLVEAFPNLGFARPIDFQHAGDGTNRLFIAEQGGTIKVFQNEETVDQAETFLDISGRINTNANEQGLLGLVFHPNFEANGYFYVNYTPSATVSLTSRFQVSATDPNRADPDSELILIEMPQPFTNHNGGQLAFGPDGFLYIASGDGGSGGDPENNAQRLENLLGAILRIDVDNPDSGRNYGIPSNNPFVGQANASDEIFAYGLRNPWRISFDPQTGDLWSGDVGQNEREEINIITAGGNYGWKLFEGTFCFSGNCDSAGLVAPIFEYNHNGDGKSVTGGYVYRGNTISQLNGKYIFGDFIDGRIWALELDGSDSDLLMDSNLNIASFGVDRDNELYICAFDGKIYAFEETN